MRRTVFTLCLLVAVALTGCAAPQWTGLFNEQAGAPYTLAGGDRLRVIVFGQDALSNSYAVDGSGRISLPLVGSVPVQGMTTDQVQRALEARYRNGFIREPRVSVEVEAFRPFFILGEVTNPGQYPYVNGMTVETAVAIAGGFTPRGWQSGADLTRAVDGRQFKGEVPITQSVRPGDTISIRERIF